MTLSGSATAPSAARKRLSDLHLWVVGGVFVLWLGLIWGWEAGYLALTYDDSFYYLKTAANAASGYGISFDRVTVTNGFHPLWMVTLTPIGLIAGQNMILMTRLVLTVQVGLVGAGLVALHRGGVLDLKRSGGLIALMVGNYYATKIVINGLESALEFALLAGFTAWWARLDGQRPSIKTAVIGGVWAGVLTLARLEMGLLAVVLILLLPCRFEKEEAAGYRDRLQMWVIGFAVYGLVAAPYVVWNYSRFGRWLPVSAAIKLERHGVRSLETGIAAVALMLAAGAGLYGWIRRQPDSLQRWKIVMPLAITCILLGGYYLYSFGWQIPTLWYLVPYLVLAAVVIGRVDWRGWQVPAGVVLGAAAIISWVVVGFSPDTIATQLALRETGYWLRDHTEPDALVAGWDVGIISAHAERRVINLDGLINSWEYKENYMDQGREETYIKDVQAVDYIAQRVFPNISAGQGRLETIDFADWTVAYIAYLNTPPSILWVQNETVQTAYIVLSRAPIEGQPLYGDFEFTPEDMP